MNKTHVQSSQETGCDEAMDVIECTHAMKALLFWKALKGKPEEAMKALREEVQKIIKIDIWDPVHLEDLTKRAKSYFIADDELARKKLTGILWEIQRKSVG